MRLSSALLIAATVTLLTSGTTAAADSVRKSAASTMTSADMHATIGTTEDSGGKRFLRYRNDELPDGEIEDEDRVNFDPSRLNALTREAQGLSASDLKKTGVKRFFKSLTKDYTPVNVPIPKDYPKLRTLFNTWYYHHYIPKMQARGG
ncbi:RxLR effector protein [Phytophthora megakarya]|uniref:RxLR effector protein n=1 Tax=Phytophthora megakarya TaxID=4795 RepID=A0A225WW39_9STRA|nr:RxLR effector protein [Phytophthora megakarya]